MDNMELLVLEGRAGRGFWSPNPGLAGIGGLLNPKVVDGLIQSVGGEGCSEPIAERRMSTSLLTTQKQNNYQHVFTFFNSHELHTLHYKF